MRQDQYEKLQALEEKLLDVFLFEADPAKWAGAGIEPAAMDKQTRGDRYWDKKNPAATLILVTKVQDLVHQTQQRADTPPPPAGEDGDDESQLDAEIASAERQAAKLLDDLTRGGRKAEFDRRVHGKAS